jgi:phosphoserine/homoserine phosphotransferase
MIAAIDLEGVLAPEIWPHLGEQFRIPELSLTTRDTGDFEELMRRRVDALRRAGLTLARVQEVAHHVEPYLGSREFLKRIRPHCQVMIISDTFHELAEPLVERLGGFNLFANRFEVDAQGRVRIPRVTQVIDAGTVINPDRVRSQMEGAAVMGIGLAMTGSPGRPKRAATSAVRRS